MSSMQKALLAAKSKKQENQKADEQVLITTQSINQKIVPFKINRVHRFLQQIHKEVFSQVTIVTLHLHTGLLDDWSTVYEECNNKFSTAALIEFVVSSAIRCKGEHQQRSFSVFNSQQSVAVTDFKVLRPIDVDDVRVQDGVSSVCLLCVVGEDGSLGVHGERGDGQRLFFAQGTVTSLDTDLAKEQPTLGLLEHRIQHEALTDCTSLLPLKNSMVVSVRVAQDWRRGLVTVDIDHLRQQPTSHSYLLPPPLLDTMLYSAEFLLTQVLQRNNQYCHFGICTTRQCSFERVEMHAGALDGLWLGDTASCEINVRNVDLDVALFDCSLWTAGGVLVVTLTGVCVLQGDAVDLDKTDTQRSASGCVELVSGWEPSPIEHVGNIRSDVLHQNNLLLRCTESGSHRVENLDQLQCQPQSGGVSVRALNTDTSSLDSDWSLGVGDERFSAAIVVVDGCADSDAAMLNSAAMLQRFLVLLQEVVQVCSSVLVVVQETSPDSAAVLSAALSGIVLCAELEHAPAVGFRFVCVCNPGTPLPAIIAHELSVAAGPMEVLYRQDQRLVRQYRAVNVREAMRRTKARMQGAFVVSGGLGGLGLQTAKLLVRTGVQHIFLLSRSGKVSHEGQGLENDLAWLLEESGASVHVVRCDVSDEAQVVAMLAEVRRQSGGAVSGVVHCAGVLRDALIRGGGAAAGCADVWNAKALSAWWLHKHTLQDNLKQFVCYSSITAALGNVGQSAYGAANRYLDSLMSERRRLGLSGVSIRWPAISGVGMAAGNSALDLSDSHSATASITSADLAAVLKSVWLSSFAASISTVLTVLPVATLAMTQFRVFQQLRDVATVYHGETGTRSVAPPVRSMFSASQVDDMVRRTVVAQLGHANFSDDTQLMSMDGLDSLGAMHLVASLGEEFRTQLMPTLVFSYPTIKHIIAHIQEVLGVSAVAGHDHDHQLGSNPVVQQLNGDMAIVGVSCRLPGDVNDLSAMWDMLSQGRDVTGEAPLHRWDTDAIVANMQGGDQQQLDRMKYGGFLSDEVLESFHSSLFGISPAEAMCMDAAQRLLLEVSYEALMDAGLDTSKLDGLPIGVFVGASGTLSSDVSSAINQKVLEDVKFSVFDATGKTLSVAAGRISYVLGLHGPCSTTDTACSSSLVALHAARRSLQHGECSVAVVVGVNVLSAVSSAACAIAGMTSPDGKCHTFDEAANGYCRGEGCGAIVLKRLSEAEADGDAIYAVVKGSAVLQDGKSASLTAPNGRAQEMLLRAALSDAGISAHDVQYIEAHGTGTKLGDPVETGAIAAVYGEGRAADNPLYVSSVKANIGHLEAAAGMAGLFAAILALQHSQAPPNAQLETLSSSCGIL